MLAAPKNCSFEEQLTAWRAFSLLLCFVGSFEATFHAPKTFSLFSNISQIVSKQCVLHIFIHYDLLIYCGQVCMEIFIIQSLLKPHTGLSVYLGNWLWWLDTSCPQSHSVTLFLSWTGQAENTMKGSYAVGRGEIPHQLLSWGKQIFFFF